MTSADITKILLRLRKLEDLGGLDSLMNRYCWQVDRKNWDTFGEVYVENGEMDFEAFGTVRGRKNIVETTRQAEECFEGMQHSQTNREFILDYKDDSPDGSVGDTATATAYLFFVVCEDTRKNSQGHFKMGGPYHFEYERVYHPDSEEGKLWGARGWRLTKMKLRLIWTDHDQNDKAGTFTSSRAPTLD